MRSTNIGTVICNSKRKLASRDGHSFTVTFSERFTVLGGLLLCAADPSLKILSLSPWI